MDRENNFEFNVGESPIKAITIRIMNINKEMNLIKKICKRLECSVFDGSTGYRIEFNGKTGYESYEKYAQKIRNSSI